MVDASTDRIKALEAKVDLQLSEIRQKLDAKLKVLEEDWPSLKVQFAQLGGRLAGYGEEVQRQAGRLDSFESHLTDWRRGQEQHLWNRFGEIQQQLDESLANSSAATAAVDHAVIEHAKRLRRLEEQLMSRDDGMALASSAEIETAVVDLAGRIENLEWRVPAVNAISPERAGYANDGFSNHRGVNMSRKILWSPEHGEGLDREDAKSTSKIEDWRIVDICSKLDQLEQEALDTQSRMEELSVRMVTLKAHQDVQEECHHSMQERLDGTVKDDRLEHVLRLVQTEGEERSRADRELSKRFGNLEATLVEIQGDLREVQADAARSMLCSAEPECPAGSAETGRGGTLVRAQELALLLLVEREAGKVADRSGRMLRCELCDGLQELKEMGSSLQSQITELDGRLTNVEMAGDN